MNQKKLHSISSNRTPSKKHHWYFYPGLVCLALILSAVGFVGYLTATEYRPTQMEPAETGTTDIQKQYQGKSLRILTFNTGYGGLGKESDFLMDGGSGTGASDKETVVKNMHGIENILQKANADIYFLQEIDKDSRRTFHQNQLTQYANALPKYEMYYAPNYVCKFVPYPVQKPIGEIHSGIATYSRYDVTSSDRYSLPVPFQWPVRTANLKRCLLVSRIPLENTSKEIVMINLHLEAYDDGEGKIAQTQQLMSLMQEEYAKGNYVIAGGDFNQTFPDTKTEIKSTSEWIPGVLEQLPSEWRYVYDDTVPTCRLLNQPYDPESERTQHYVLDGFIVSSNIDVLRVETMDEKFEYSDHNPVVMDIQLK